MTGHDFVLILDFGSQYTQLIARRIREQGVYCEIHPCTLAPRALSPEIGPRLKGIVLSGGPSSVYDHDAPPFDRGWLDKGVPVLGICYGMQLMTQAHGGEVKGAAHREYGHADIRRSEGADKLFAGLPDTLPVWMSHGDQVARVPDGFRALASTPTCPVAAFADDARRHYGIQFHPEVTHTRDGVAILRNFVFGVCEARADWSMGSFVDEQVAKIRAQVGDGEVLCALSGGVDSSVTAAILHEALGNRLHCIFVDNGLLRQGERESVANEFKDFQLTVVDARKRFLDALAGVTDPERKRKIIGEAFIRVFEEESKRFASATWLAQGTLYPDVIESVSFRGPSATIKSHHNVGGLPERMHLKLIEPLRELFKDEVRALGRELGLSAGRIDRQPFPGPGLAVRCLGELTETRLDVLRAADAIVDQEIRAAGLTDSLWQSFAVLLPVRSVGVMGDNRTYDEACAIRAVHSTDGMTAHVAELPWPLLAKMSSRIINEVKGINRVVYDISTKPPATIEWE
ncbi:MAG: glutamine-hydrolyzing GMP synthase [Myxococcota bacterium]